MAPCVERTDSSISVVDKVCFERSEKTRSLKPGMRFRIAMVVESF